MSKPRTQRAWAWMNRAGRWSISSWQASDSEVPVLVVPEADVRGCRHEDCDIEGLGGIGGELKVCANCGSFRWDGLRWQRPKVLRVGRAKK